MRTTPYDARNLSKKMEKMSVITTYSQLLQFNRVDCPRNTSGAFTYLDNTHCRHQ